MSYPGGNYYDRYVGDSSHKKKGYTRVIAKPGFAEQSAEFNEIQSIALDHIGRLGKSLYKDGYIVDGCSININGNVVTIGSGSIYLEGLIRKVEDTTLTISGVGTERIVAKIETKYITATNDPSLRDPAQGADNFGLEGADRESQIVKFSVVQGDSTGDGAEIFHLEDGEKINEKSNDDNNLMMDLLAERTFDENGSYKVNGIDIRNLPEVVNEKIRCYITAGKAYVLGYPVFRDTMSSISLEQSKETRFVQSESHYYNSSYSKYELSNGPVANVNNLTCLVSVIKERKYRGSIKGGYDSLNNVPVDSITRVYTLNPEGEVDKVYKQNIDYKLYNDQVDWSLIGDDSEEPAPGTTYYVDYVYNKTMVRGVDFDIENKADTAYLKFLDGDKPDENSRMYISYYYTLARRDLLMLDKDGNILILSSAPDKLNSLITPYNGSDEYLELGYVDVYPTDALTGEVIEGIARVVNYKSVRFTQENLYTMLRRIDNIEDDLATLDMEREIVDGEDTSSLNGFFTDSFANINKSDLSYSAVIEGREIKYDACIDFDMNELTTSALIKSDDLIINNAKSDDYATYGTVISAPYELELAVVQKYATGTMLVNPYASYGPMCQVVLTPNQDNWVDQNSSVVVNTLNNTAYTYSSQVFSRSTSGASYSTSSSTTSYTGTTSSVRTTTSQSSSVYEFMRQKDVEVQGRAFGADMKNIYVKFNGIPVDLTPIKDTAKGENIEVDGKVVATVNANDNGSFDAKLTVPAKVPCGTVDVVFTGVDDFGEEHTGESKYTANGTLITTTTTNTLVTTQHYNVLTTTYNYIYTPPVRTYNSDPLAQSFILSNEHDRVLMKIGMYFATKSRVRPAIVQVCNMVNGYPGNEVYAEVTLMPDQVNIPTNPKTPVVTEVVLNKPVYCKKGTAYCFVILSDSNEYSMYYANMGENILGRESETLVVNPYAVGVLFSSSNSQTWTAHQGSDLKFELYRSRYTGKGEIIFDEVSASDVTGLFLDAAYQDNANVGLTWQYRYVLLDGTYSEWLPIDTLVFRELNTTTNKISLKAIINTDFSTSPYIDMGRVSLRSFIDQKHSTYISTHISADQFDDEYQAMKISYLATMPSGADHDVYYMDDERGEWVKLEQSDHVHLETKRVDEEFSQYIWSVDKLRSKELNPESPGAKFFKIRIDLSTTLTYNRPRIKKLSTIFKYD